MPNTNNAVNLLQSALEEPSFSLPITEADACLLIAALVLLEHDQILLARKASDNGNFKKSRYRRDTARQCLALAEQIELSSEMAGCQGVER